MLLVGLSTFGTALAISLCLTAIIRWWAPWWGLVDRPTVRKAHGRVTPLGGGVAIYGSIVLTIGAEYLIAAALQAAGRPLGWVPAVVYSHLSGVLSQAGRVGLILGAATVVMLMGLIDDRWGLSYRFRLVIEAGLALGLIGTGVRFQLFLPPTWAWLSGLLTLVWIVGLINAFNFLDNMDALCGGVAWICSALLFLVTGSIHDLFIAVFFLVLMGALAGFLVFNWPPARIFMGDAGSNLIGFLIAVVTVVATFNKRGYLHVTVLAPLCILAVPLYDSVSVIVIRLAQGRSPFLADRSHFSHRLVDRGLPPRSAVLTIYLVTLATGLGALLLYQVQLSGAIVIFVQVLCLVGVIAILELAGRRES